MAPDKKDPPKKKSPRPKKSGPPVPSFTVFLQEAERLKATALTMLQADGHHAPLVIAWCRDGHREVIGLSLREAGPSLGTVLRAVVQARQVQCFVAISEAWMTRGAAASLEVMPSASPEREQVLCVSAIYPEAKRMWVYPFASEGGRVVVGALLSSEGLTLAGGIPEALNGEEGRP